jgi:hypothetical protein
VGVSKHTGVGNEAIHARHSEFSASGAIIRSNERRKGAAVTLNEFERTEVKKTRRSSLESRRLPPPIGTNEK